MKIQFKIKKINKYIYIIQEPWFKEHANFYLFGDKKTSLLIDAGLGFFNVKEFLEKKGFKNIKVTLTHSHFDHFGGIRHFLPKEICITKKIYKNLKNEQLMGLEFLKQDDFIREVPYKKIKELFNPFIFSAKASNLKNIKVGIFDFKIIDVPAHTNDSVIFFDKKNKILVTGDALYDGKMYYDFLNSDKKEVKKVYKKISEIRFDLLLPGHNKIFYKKRALEIIKNNLITTI